MEHGWVESLLAQAGEGAGEGQAEQQQPGQRQPGGQGGAREACPTQMFIPLSIIFVLLYFLILRPQRRQEQQRRELLTALKKNDRVVTAGGIYGVVTNVNPNRDEVTIRVDDDTNTKIRVTRGSIQRVIAPTAEEGEKGSG